MPIIIYVTILKNDKVEVYNENMDFIKRFNSLTKYLEWVISECSDCIRRQLS